MELSLFIVVGSIALVVVGILFIFMIMGLLAGLPYVPTNWEKIEKIIALSRVQPHEKVVDLGSGDGRILIEFAKAGIEVHGYEINPFLVWYSRRNIKARGLEGKAFVHYKNFWKQDLSSYDIIVIYGIGYIMKRLEEKLAIELKPGARVISSAFEFPTWKAVSVSNGLFLYDGTGTILSK